MSDFDRKILRALERNMEVQVPLDWVKVVDRFRRDLGDLDSLAKSMAGPPGLINPITVTPDGRLVAGQRRLEAARRLGWKEIPARIVDSLDDAVARLTAERDENTERKPMTPEELVQLGKALEEIERPKAAERQHGHGAGPGKKIDAGDSNRSVHVNGTVDTREKVAKALGTSTASYSRAKTVVDAANDTTAPPEEQAIAKAALADMNATGNIAGNYKKVVEARNKRLGREKNPNVVRASEQRKVLDSAVNTLAGVSHGLKLIDQIHPNVTAEEAARWADGLSEPRRVIESLIRRLRAHSQEG